MKRFESLLLNLDGFGESAYLRRERRVVAELKELGIEWELSDKRRKGRKRFHQGRAIQYCIIYLFDCNLEYI